MGETTKRRGEREQFWRQLIGEQRRSGTSIVRASLHVMQHVRFKYACRRCQEHVAMAGKPAQPIDRGLP
jgi:transposase